MAEGSQDVKFIIPQLQKVFVQVHSGAASRCGPRLILHPATRYARTSKYVPLAHQRSLTNGGGYPS